jgi:hypothetical protein
MNTNLTQNQQQLISNITAEFIKINASAKKENTFNLIDIQPLFNKCKEIEDNKKIVETDDNLWNNIAMDEAQRIADLLQADMPFACVERYGKSNGHYDMPKICIQREKGLSGHHENYVSISVVVVTELEYLSHGICYNKGVSLAYKADYLGNDTHYSSIEELFVKSDVTEQIRRKIINWIKL